MEHGRVDLPEHGSHQEPSSPGSRSARPEPSPRIGAARLVWAILLILVIVIGAPMALVSTLLNRDQTVEVARQFADGRPATATATSVVVAAEDSGDAGYRNVIDDLVLTLPGVSQQVHAENVGGFGKIEVDVAARPELQDPAEFYPPYTAPLAVHVLGSGDRTRAMTDSDITYWTSTPLPRALRWIRRVSWISVGLAAASVMTAFAIDRGRRQVVS